MDLRLRRRFPPRTYAPLCRPDQLAPLVAETGHKFYTVAYGGEGDLEVHLAQLRELGGDAVLLFPTELIGAIEAAAAPGEPLAGAYQAIVDRHTPLWVDFALEGDLLLHRPGIDRRNKALGTLQAANPGLRVCYTFGDGGLTGHALYVLKSAAANRVRVSTVGVACRCVEAAKDAHAQLRAAGLPSSINLVVHPGVSQSGEFFLQRTLGAQGITRITTVGYSGSFKTFAAGKST